MPETKAEELPETAAEYGGVRSYSSGSSSSSKLSFVMFGKEAFRVLAYKLGHMWIQKPNYLGLIL